MKCAQLTAIEFIRARWPDGIPAEAIERAYLSGRLVEETSRAAVGEGGEERLSNMLAAAWDDDEVIEEDMDEAGDPEGLDEPIPFRVVGVEP
jgi:hypothetical protein